VKPKEPIHGSQTLVSAVGMAAIEKAGLRMLGVNVRLPLCHATELKKMSAALKNVWFEPHRKDLRLEDLLSS